MSNPHSKTHQNFKGSVFTSEERQPYCYISSFDPDHDLCHRMKAADHCVPSHHRTGRCPHPDKLDNPMRAGWMPEPKTEARESLRMPAVPGWELWSDPLGLRWSWIRFGLEALSVINNVPFVTAMITLTTMTGDSKLDYISAQLGSDSAIFLKSLQTIQLHRRSHEHRNTGHIVHLALGFLQTYTW